MKITETNIKGVVIIEPRVFEDSRGYFFESYSKRIFDEMVCPTDFVQDNESCSLKGVVRGLHFQKPPYAQAKLLRCVKGSVIDVALDLRIGSPTFGKAAVVELSEKNKRQLFIPKGFAHGFAVISEKAIFQYKCDEYYHPEAEGGISILDESLEIDWKISIKDAILSEKDKCYGSLKEFNSPFTL